MSPAPPQSDSRLGARITQAASWLAEGWRAITDEFDPALCAACWQPPRRLCSSCLLQLAPDPQIEYRFGRPVSTVFPYAGVPRSLVMALKEHGEPVIARALARALKPALLNAHTSPTPNTRVDLIVMPPTRAASMRQRGYVPIRMVARAAGFRTSSPFRVAEHVVDQVGLNVSSRQANLEGAFLPKKTASLTPTTRIAGKRVLLLDDVVTTGSTLFELERAVTAQGGEVVSRLAICSVRR